MTNLVKRKVDEILASNSYTSHSSKRQTTVFKEMIDTLKRNHYPCIENFNGDGEPFLSPTEAADFLIEPNPSEATLVLNAYPIFKRKLIVENLSNYDLINGEVHRWLPPSYTTSYNSNQLLGPGLFIALPFLVEYYSRRNYPIEKNGITYQHGKLKNTKTYPSILILDAKCGESFSEAQIGEFFNYFINPTSFFKCRTRGMLFNNVEFILVEFSFGSLSYYLRGNLTSGGTLQAIKGFLIPCDTSIHDSFLDAFTKYQIRPVQVPPMIGNPQTAFLGMGSFGIVIKVIDNNNNYFALKVVQYFEDKPIDSEYYTIKRLSENNLALPYIVGIVPNSYRLF